LQKANITRVCPTSLERPVTYIEIADLREPLTRPFASIQKIPTASFANYIFRRLALATLLSRGSRERLHPPPVVESILAHKLIRKA